MYHAVNSQDNHTRRRVIKMLCLGLLATLAVTSGRAQVTFSETNFTFEAEDFNFTDPYPGGTPGQYFNNPEPCYTIGGGGANCYFDRVGTEAVDQHEINNAVTVSVPTTNEVYRFGDLNDLIRDEYVDTFLTSDTLSRTQYTASGFPDYEVRNVVVGEWLNYTRSVPAGNYRIYLRAASSSPISARLDRVDNAAITNQNLTGLGSFQTTNATAGYEFIPLADDSGTNPVVVAFTGNPTALRATALSAGYTPNFYMFVETTDGANLPPTVQITAPTPGVILTEGVSTNIVATATDAESTVTNVSFYAGVQGGALSLIGETATAPYIMPWTPPSLGSIRTYTIKVVAQDSTGLQGADQMTVVVQDPAIQIVSTAVGNGADAEMREQNNLGVSYGGSYRTISSRTTDSSTLPGNNEIIALRFDLSGKDFAKLADVKVNLTSSRDDTSTRQLSIYGVIPGTTSAPGAVNAYTTENWDETALASFGDMPGLQLTDGNNFTQSLNSNSVVLLGGISGKATKGEVKTFDSAGITDFLQTNAGNSQVTFLIANSPNYTTTGQARFSTKEASTLEGGTPIGSEGDFAPFIQFKVLPTVPPSVNITNPADGATLDGGVQVSIGVDASDSDGTVTNVEFYAGTAEPLTLIGSDATAPYSIPWTPTAISPVNNYVIRVVATDNEGASSTASINVTVVDPTLTSVSTAFGSGADVEMVEQNATAARNASDLHTRFNATTRNELVGLKFDLSGQTKSDLNNVSLNLVSHRTDASTRVIDIYGVKQGTVSGSGAFTTETWSDTTVSAWGDLPGLLTSDGDVATMSIDTANLTLLVDDFTMTGLTEGQIRQASSAALTSFVKNYAGSDLITFLIVAGNTSGGQFTFSSKEATQTATGAATGSAGDFAPYLSFTVGAVAPPTLDYSVTGGNTINFTWIGSFKLQAQTNNLSTGLNGAWGDYPGGSASPVSVPIDTTKGTVFFRLATP